MCQCGPLFGFVVSVACAVLSVPSPILLVLMSLLLFVLVPYLFCRAARFILIVVCAVFSHVCEMFSMCWVYLAEVFPGF